MSEPSAIGSSCRALPTTVPRKVALPHAPGMPPPPTPRPPRRRASSAPWSGSSRCSRRTPAAARRSTASTATTSNAARSTPSSSRYRDRVAKNPKDGTGWLILGLLEVQRGQDAAAVAALRQAETDRPEDPLPPYYLGQALVLVGQPEQAAAAFERALERKPARNDLLEIFQALGRVYQRTQKTDQALPVWNRLEALFPDDPRVQEQIASALAEEDQPAQALPRFEALAKKATDPFRQVQLAMQAADLKVRLGRSDEALHDFEAMLGKLRPDSWLHREVRRKIEEVFLRNDDQAGLVAYYEHWTKKEPEDVEALVRLGRTLAGMGRAAEAQAWYEKAIKLAPSRRDLRLALIAQLARTRSSPRPPRSTRPSTRPSPTTPTRCATGARWSCATRPSPQAERKAAAAAIWRKLLEAKPNDPVTTAQVADLFRQAEMVDDALALYRKAIELAPGNPQYHEYLGEYLHNLKRPDEAMAAWAKIAEGPTGTPRTWPGWPRCWPASATSRRRSRPLTEAVELEKDDFDLRLKLAELSAPARAVSTTPRPSSPPRRKLAEKDEEKDGRPRSPRQERPGGRPAGRADRRDCGRSSTATRNADGRALGRAGPLPRGRRQAARGGPGRRPGDRRSTRGRSRPGPWRPGSASRPATWATPPTPCAGWPRSTAATGPST